MCSAPVALSLFCGSQRHRAQCVKRHLLRLAHPHDAGDVHARIGAGNAERRQRFSPRHRPQFGAAVVAAAGEDLPCRVERDVGDVLTMPREDVMDLAVAHLPRMDGSIGAATGQPTPVRTECRREGA